jgi:hypothetical protein
MSVQNSRSSCTRLTKRRIDVSRRLRRAILLNDVALVKRIVLNNPHKLGNPDFADKSNTSLHLAAKHGYTQIAVRHVDDARTCVGGLTAATRSSSLHKGTKRRWSAGTTTWRRR